MDSKSFSKFLPFSLTIVVVIVDQLVKAWVVATIPQGTVHASYLSDFLWIVHVRNSAIGFSIGDGLPEVAKRILFVAIPLVVMVLIIIYMLRSRELDRFQVWMLAGILGGGVGNLVDRMFRPDWVVDFISVKVYGLFGFERWPTFNIADATIVVTGILLMMSLLFFDGDRKTSEVEDVKEVFHE